MACFPRCRTASISSAGRMWKRTTQYARCSGRNRRSRVDIDTSGATRRRAGVAAIVASAICFGALATLIGLGALGYGGQAFTFFTALTLAPAGLVALLLYLYPALVAVLSASLLHERLSAAQLLALAVALVGTVLTIGPASSASPLGVALGIAAAAIYAVYIVAGSRLTARVPPQTMATVVIAAAGAVFLVATLA